MARTSIGIAASVDDAWTSLQDLGTWEGVAGIEDLRDPRHDAAGNLRGFRFAMDTAVGRVSGKADVDARRPGMTIRGEQKGLALTIQVVLSEGQPMSCRAMVDASARSTSFLSKPLALTLNALLDNAIDDEADKIARRCS